jgi:hypothetical protein
MKRLSIVTTAPAHTHRPLREIFEHLHVAAQALANDSLDADGIETHADRNAELEAALAAHPPRNAAEALAKALYGLRRLESERDDDDEILAVAVRAIAGLSPVAPLTPATELAALGSCRRRAKTGRAA